MTEANSRVHALEARVKELEAQLQPVGGDGAPAAGDKPEKQSRASQDQSGIIAVLQDEAEALRKVAKRESDLREDMQKKLQAGQARYEELWGQHLKLLAQNLGL